MLYRNLFTYVEAEDPSIEDDIILLKEDENYSIQVSSTSGTYVANKTFFEESIQGLLIEKIFESKSLNVVVRMLLNEYMRDHKKKL